MGSVSVLGLILKYQVNCDPLLSETWGSAHMKMGKLKGFRKDGRESFRGKDQSVCSRVVQPLRLVFSRRWNFLIHSLGGGGSLILLGSRIVVFLMKGKTLMPSFCNFWEDSDLAGV